MPMNKEKKKIVYEYSTGIGLTVLSICSVVITVLMAIRGNTRLPWMVAISLILLFLVAIFRIRVRMAFRSLHRNLRLRRKAHATRGVILRFPDQPGQPKDPEETEDPEKPAE